MKISGIREMRCLGSTIVSIVEYIGSKITLKDEHLSETEAFVKKCIVVIDCRTIQLRPALYIEKHPVMKSKCYITGFCTELN